MLIVLRHGRTEANRAGELLGRRDPSLDETGRAQAAAAGAVLPAGARVISSPLARCRETAAALDPDHEVDERLIELNYGDLEGTPVADVPRATWDVWRANDAWKPPAGESHNELAARVCGLLDELAVPAATSDIVLVSHVSPIKAAMAWALGVPISISWRCFVAQASILRIATGGVNPSLRSFNETSHLAHLA
ncbi:MAG: histidine phosphatase family protein [Acidimicrobiales bacterium]|jgi:broad specificity phosphatase PhoE|nr:histidine phosphatase family protein [Acidimicrobiales bacterium]